METSKDRKIVPPHSQDSNKKHIEISLGMACNNKCIFCLNVGPRNVVPFDQVLQEAREYAAAGYNSIGLIGGDPTVYPRIGELGSRIKELGYEHIHMISNGRLFSKMEFLDEMIAAGFNRFSVSIHSHLPEIEDKLTRRPGGHAQKIQGLKNLVKRFNEGAFRDRVSINTIMHKQNLDDLDVSIRYFSDIGIMDMRLLFVRPEGYAREHSGILTPRMTLVRNKLPSLIRTARLRRMNIMMDPPPFCLFYDIPGFKRILAADYLDFVISDAPDKDAVRETFSWNDYRLTQKTKEKSCFDCCFNNICEGVWTGYVEIFGFDEFRPVTEAMLSSITPGPDRAD